MPVLDSASAVPSYMSSSAVTSSDSGSAVAKRRWWARCALWLGLTSLGVFSLLIAAWLALHWAILPHIDDWRPELERQATKALGVPVRIGSISANSSGWIPAMDLRDVRIVDANGRDALRLPRVSAAVSPRSLLAFELRFSQLLLDSPELLLRRDAQGRVFVAVPGHYNWTFDDPVFRVLALRGICWAAQQQEDRLVELATIGARVAE